MFTSFKQMIARIHAFFRSGKFDRELDQELESHLTMLVEDNLRRGLAPKQPPVLTAGYVVVIGVGTPNLGVLPVLIGLAHPAVSLAIPRAASSPHAPGRAAHFAFVWEPASPAAMALRR